MTRSTAASIQSSHVLNAGFNRCAGCSVTSCHTGPSPRAVREKSNVGSMAVAGAVSVVMTSRTNATRNWRTRRYATESREARPVQVVSTNRLNSARGPVVSRASSFSASVRQRSR